MESNYETDFYQWTIDQSIAIKEGRWQDIDVANLAEEVESMGKQQRQELTNRLIILIGHLLKWNYQWGGRGASWKATILEQRGSIHELMEENPSLQPYLNGEAIRRSYKGARALAIRETNLDVFPEECPYSIADILNEQFFPGN